MSSDDLNELPEVKTINNDLKKIKDECKRLKERFDFLRCREHNLEAEKEELMMEERKKRDELKMMKDIKRIVKEDKDDRFFRGYIITHEIFRSGKGFSTQYNNIGDSYIGHYDNYKDAYEELDRILKNDSYFKRECVDEDGDEEYCDYDGYYLETPDEDAQEDGVVLIGESIERNYCLEDRYLLIRL